MGVSGNSKRDSRIFPATGTTRPTRPTRPIRATQPNRLFGCFAQGELAPSGQPTQKVLPSRRTADT